jgi:hypothetical protein
MKQRIAGFQGETPRTIPRLLPDNAAYIAVNMMLEDGSLTPLRGPLAAYTFSAPVSEYKAFYKKYDGTWLAWETEVNATRGPITDSDRTYYTGDGHPKVNYGAGAGVTWDLAVLPPATPLVIAVSSGVLDTETEEDVYYVYTYVTTTGEESQPSGLSNKLLCSPLQVISLVSYTITSLPVTRDIDKIRLYRSQTDSIGNTTLFFIREATIASILAQSNPLLILHDPVVEPNQNSLPSLDWTSPIDTLVGLCAGPNGMMAAFSGKDLYFCEPFFPHAWPVKYSLSMDFDIVGVASIGSSFIIMTTGTPYVCSGTDPASMVLTKLEQNLPCVASRSIVDMGNFVMYASTEGLVQVTNNGVNNITAAMFTQKQWTQYLPATFIASQHFGRYIFRSSRTDWGSGPVWGGIIDLTGQQPFLIEHDTGFTSTFFEIGSGKLYVMTGGNVAGEWNAGSTLTMWWSSKEIYLPMPVNFGCYLLQTSNYSGTGACTLNFYADDALVFTTAAPDRNKVGRLPGGFLAERWFVEILGNIPITAISFAHGPEELATP